MYVTMQDVQHLLEIKQGVQVIKHGLMEENMEILFAGEKSETETQLVVDVLQERGGTTTLFVRPRINSTKTHGTGCTLSAATACALAQGSTRTSFSCDPSLQKKWCVKETGLPSSDRCC